MSSPGATMKAAIALALFPLASSYNSTLPHSSSICGLTGSNCQPGDCCFGNVPNGGCSRCPYGWQHVHDWANRCFWTGGVCEESPPTPAPTLPPPVPPLPPVPPAPTPGFCETGQDCHALDCCNLDSSCNTCPNGYFEEETWCLQHGNHMCAPTAPIPGPPCFPTPTIPPPLGNCNQFFKKALNWSTCIMVNGRMDLPSVSPEKFFDVILLRKTIVGETEKQHKEAKAMRLYHSAVLIRESCGASEQETFFIEYDAANFDERLMVPIGMDMRTRTITWNNSGYVGWYKDFDPSDWPGPDAQTFIGGGVHGSQVNAWLDEIPAWREQNHEYLVWSDFNQNDFAHEAPGGPTEVFKDNLCHAFSRWNLGMIYAKGADFSWNQAPICQNYIPLVGNGLVDRLDVNVDVHWSEIAYFYSTFAKIMNESSQANSTEPLKEWMAEYQKFVLHNETGYYLAHLDAPYLYEDKNHTMRPMLLNWQNPAIFKYGKCQWRGNGTSEFSALVSSQPATLILV